jgi:hypothetical protein
MMIHMLVDVIPKGDMDKFHRNETVKGIVKLLLSDHTRTKVEMLRLLSLVSKSEELKPRLDEICNISSYDEQNLIMSYVSFLYKIYKNPQHSNLRGAILEKLIYELLDKKYRDRSNLNISCSVCINDWKSNRTVDVFYYSTNNNCGETFECKVNPNRLEKHDIETLKAIHSKSNNSITPCIASFVDTQAIKIEVEDLGFSIEPIKLFGTNNIMSCCKL